MPTTQHHDADRETLSALFDGELDDAAARFAVKRLDHDRQWREACGRWQLAGDALRGQASGVAPAGFADRVGAALRDGDAVAASTVAAPATRTATPMHRNWIGGAALAASVAVAALFVVRPFSQPGVSPLPATPLAASAQPTAPASDTAETGVAQFSSSPATQAMPSQVPPVRGRPVFNAEAATTVATADVQRPTGDTRPLEPAKAATSNRGIEDPTATAATAIASIADVATPSLEPASPHPFLPPGEIVSRPWPRAVLPNYPAGNAFNVNFDNGAGTAGQVPSPGASSFYPFDPRMLEAEPVPRPAADEPGWPRR
ncbi:sigma-E factor negative regulatory protein [Novilysobacter erysipheiresistens]|uniref:Sigma-E factor negative regulatory protein n=1 Tax=Novilysobacter erysipheiresistens TaxID=1749332 RepID=A0ABU7YWJ8_9GAMM